MTVLEKKRVFRSWLYVGLWMIFIFTMSTDLGSTAHTSRLIRPIVLFLKPSASAEDFDWVHFMVRKAAHLSEYAFLGILLFRAIRITFAARGPRLWPLGIVIALLASAGYAATDEYHQSFVPGRESSIRDVMIDSTGALIGLTLISLTAKIAEKRERKLVSV